MDEAAFIDLSAWLTQSGLAGTSEADIVSGFCERCVAAGLPLGRAQVFVDTLHPVHEGRMFRWGYGSAEPAVLEYGRTSPDALAASGFDPRDVETTERWQGSAHYRMLQTNDSLLRRRLNAATENEFSLLPEWRAAGMTDYVAIIIRFAAAGVIGEMDGVYTAWGTRVPDGFTDGHIAVLKRIAPYLALAIKSVALARMTQTLMETYLGRDAGRRVLGGRIVRGIAEKIDAVVWFSDLRGFTRITDTAPEHVIPLLNDYSDAVFLAIHKHGGDVLKLIGDGTLAIFTAEDRMHACSAALSAAIAAPRRRRTQKTACSGGQARYRHVSRLACRRSRLRQCRKPRTAGLYRHRPGGQRGQPHRGDVPLDRPAGFDIGVVCRSRGHQAPPGFGGTLCAARRVASPGAVHARSRGISRCIRCAERRAHVRASPSPTFSFAVSMLVRANS
jgi:adenylate cyclase